MSPKHQVEATAPHRCSFVHSMFHYAFVSGGAALPGAVPHLGRSTRTYVCRPVSSRDCGSIHCCAPGCIDLPSASAATA
jgi:hypothetical protein